MKALKFLAVIALVAAPALSFAQTEQPVTGDSAVSTAYGDASNASDSAARGSFPQDGVIGLGPIYKNP